MACYQLGPRMHICLSPPFCVGAGIPLRRMPTSLSSSGFLTLIHLQQIGPLVTLPLPALVIFDLPKKRPVMYQSILMVSIWSWWVFVIRSLFSWHLPGFRSVDAVLVMYLCGYYGSHSHWSCGRRDFVRRSLPSRKYLLIDAPHSFTCFSELLGLISLFVRIFIFSLRGISYSSALPTVGMFGLSMARIPTLVGSITFTVLSSALL
jgi:osomolarity two-component system, sensor histidine kinase SLN1